eukprot:8985604-Alexandrium_andersonii.AAC.1
MQRPCLPTQGNGLFDQQSGGAGGSTTEGLQRFQRFKQVRAVSSSSEQLRAVSSTFLRSLFGG